MVKVGQVIGFAIGNGLVNGIRYLSGLETGLLNEPAVVVGAIFSVMGSLMAAGVFTDWMLWVGGHKTPLKHGAPAGKPEWFRYLGVDVNHKVIGIQYGVTSILVLFIGGIFAIFTECNIHTATAQHRFN